MTNVAGIDHVAFAVADLEATIRFYGDILGLVPVGEPYRIDDRVAVQRIGAGDILLSVHQVGNDARPVADNPVVGALDICFEWTGTLDTARVHLAQSNIELVEGPVPRRLRSGEAAQSLYFRDPDGNLIELMARA